MTSQLDNTAQREGGGWGYRLYALDGDNWKERPEYRKRQGGNGFGLSEEGVMYTLTTVDRHIVALCAVEDGDEG